MLKICYVSLEELAMEGKCPCPRCTAGWAEQTMQEDGIFENTDCRSSCEYYELYEDIKDGEKTKANYVAMKLINEHKDLWKRLAKL